MSGGHDPSIGRQWPKGTSGNPGGRPKKKHVTKMYERILANPNKRKQLEEAVFNRMISGRMVGSLELRECADRTEGKVSQIVDMNVTGTITLEQVLEAKKKAKKD